MFGLVTRGAHEAALLEMESRLVFERNRNEGYLARIRLGEEYRARLEEENRAVKEANRQRVREVDSLKGYIRSLEDERKKLEMELREARLIKGSWESRWTDRAERGSVHPAP